MAKPKNIFFSLINNTVYNYAVLIWQTANRFLTIVFLISFLQTFAYQLIWLSLPAPFPWLPALGVVFINLAYGYVITYLFYLMTIVIPIIRKKINLFRYFNNKIVFIDMEISEIFASIGLNKYDKNARFEQLLYNKLKLYNLNERTVNTHLSSIMFPNFHQFLIYKMHKIKSLVQEVLIFQDALSIETIQYLTLLEGTVYNLNRHPYSLMTNVNGRYIYHDIVKLPYYSNKLFQVANLRNVHLNRLLRLQYDDEEKQYDLQTSRIYNEEKD